MILPRRVDSFALEGHITPHAVVSNIRKGNANNYGALSSCSKRQNIKCSPSQLRFSGVLRLTDASNCHKPYPVRTLPSSIRNIETTALFMSTDKINGEGSSSSNEIRIPLGLNGRVVTMEKVEITKDQEKLLREKHNLDEEEPIMWRVLLHNDNSHTFQYVTQALVKVIGWRSREEAFEIVVEAHRHRRATIATVWKPLAEKYCLGLQRQGLTASISPDEDFVELKK